jgi:hypothetical protein
MNEMGGACDTHACRVLVGMPEGKRLHGRPRHRWDDLRMDLKNWLVWHGLDCSGCGYRQVVGFVKTLLNLRGIS